MAKAKNPLIFNSADLNEVSKYIQQALATVNLIMQCTEATSLPGTNGPTLNNSLWAVMDRFTPSSRDAWLTPDFLPRPPFPETCSD